ncbi:MAG: glutamate racemase [Oscillospiraceae bacterium]|nr:glutamate racemase [Oscillospiraceae bacterium]
MDNRPIGIFDSGLGGLTAVKQINRLLPNENVIYFGDTGRVPYGTRSRETIIKYAEQDIEFLLGFNVKMVIAACGTVSSVFPEEKIKKLPVPYFGVVNSAAQAACSVNSNGRIGVIGTSSAVKSGAYGRAIRAIKPDTKVIGRPCPLFVPLVENGLIDDDCEITELSAKMYLDQFKNEDIDTLIMGCTHYPLIRNIIGRVVGEDVTLIDPGEETVKSLKTYMTANGMLSSNTEKGTRAYYASDNIDSFKGIASKLLGEELENCSVVSVAEN